MKLRNLFFASVALAGLFSACSNEMEETVNNGNNETNTGSAYASFSLKFPAVTRAATEEVGTAGENEVKEVTLLFFDGTNNLQDIKTLDVTAFKEDAAANIYTTKEAFLVSKGDRFIYAFVNAQAKIKALLPGDSGAAWTLISGIGTESAKQLTENGFAMSNAKTVVNTPVTYTSAADAVASPIQIQVERSVAKIKYTGENFKFDIKRSGDNVLIGNVTLTNMDLINGNSEYFYLRRVSASADGSASVIGGVEASGVNYVVDPNFTLSMPSVTLPALNHTESKAIAKDATFYCLENTMSQAGQYNGATTGIMFKAQVQVAGQQNAGTFYRYNGAIYTNVGEVKKAAKIEDATDVTAWDVAAWKAKDVDYYKDGYCYYPFWIKHHDNNEPAVMGVMEFGVVRNNVYLLKVTSIKEIGAPTPEVDPENPDETEKAYIAVAVEILPWTVRSNENIEL